uniref:Uncharacterized protein n=1 Tax=Picea glauca TaxID=3330 RepID=A0A117NI99_PICGL|nr:hypothetical protein ABT39_MTgene2853 [Picea glauca]
MHPPILPPGYPLRYPPPLPLLSCPLPRGCTFSATLNDVRSILSARVSRDKHLSVPCEFYLQNSQ